MFRNSANGKRSEVQFVFVVENGPLEAQALLLVESLRRFGGRHARATATAVSPRSTRRPSRATIRKLRRLRAEYAPFELEGSCGEYMASWRVHALAAVERAPGPEVIVQLDTDTVFLGDIGPLCIGSPVEARPVDYQGIATTGPGDGNERYWSELCRLAGIKIDQLPFLRTSIDGARIRAMYQAGFVVSRRTLGLFSRAEEILRLSVDADLRPLGGSGLNFTTGTGEVGVAGSEWWACDQAMIAVAAANLGVAVGQLNDRIDVPVNCWDELQRKPQVVLHAHYHDMLSAAAAQPNPLLDDSVPIAADAARWLRGCVPLEAEKPRPSRLSWPSVRRPRESLRDPLGLATRPARGESSDAG